MIGKTGFKQCIPDTNTNTDLVKDAENMKNVKSSNTENHQM